MGTTEIPSKWRQTNVGKPIILPRVKLRVVLLLATALLVQLAAAAAAATAAALRRPRPLEPNEANQWPILWPPTVDHDISSMATTDETTLTSASWGMSRCWQQSISLWCALFDHQLKQQQHEHPAELLVSCCYTTKKRCLPLFLFYSTLDVAQPMAIRPWRAF